MIDLSDRPQSRRRVARQFTSGARKLGVPFVNNALPIGENLPELSDRHGLGIHTVAADNLPIDDAALDPVKNRAGNMDIRRHKLPSAKQIPGPEIMRGSGPESTFRFGERPNSTYNCGVVTTTSAQFVALSDSGLTGLPA